jgi:hypothetical protein
MKGSRVSGKMWGVKRRSARLGERDLRLSDLRRGDEVMISTRPPVVTDSGVAVSALLREATTVGAVTLDASEARVMRRVQAPLSLRPAATSAFLDDEGQALFVADDDVAAHTFRIAG